MIFIEVGGAALLLLLLLLLFAPVNELPGANFTPA